MQVIGHNGATEFLTRAKVWLERAEAENNLILGISSYFAANPGRSGITPYFITVEETGTLVGAALMTPPRHLIINRMDEPALTALVDYFVSASIPVSGVVGPNTSTRLFSGYWKTRTGRNSSLKRSYRLYACEEVMFQTASRGRLRPATESDESLVTRLVAEFCREAGIDDETEGMTARVPNEIARKTLYIWDDAEVVSMALVQRETAHGISISMVYTPPNHRKQGYATSCVAAITQRMLDSKKNTAASTPI